ncbi:hypothetical protein HPB52_017217 [Rhipicephalus sanguineus]|uniref:Metalloendopeptidase n=1 Tax=Rhipicephalus sanguineus TaxID=34632 RepID=A0A9D4PN44_RHISA|nr:hypothetical protein HPB52_017217 [Rhipicephalus sanguineus]
MVRATQLVLVALAIAVASCEHDLDFRIQLIYDAVDSGLDKPQMNRLVLSLLRMLNFHSKDTEVMDECYAKGNKDIHTMRVCFTDTTGIMEEWVECSSSAVFKYQQMLHEVPKLDGGQAMFQGDMLMTERDLLDMYALVPSRNITWPGGIVPYKISESSANEADLIRQGVAHWMNNSCLMFRELEKDDTTTDFILFIRGRGWGQWCTRSDMPSGFCTSSRAPTASRFVVVNYPNILEGLRSQFDPDQNKREYGARYDYTSVMHYSPTAFAASPEMKTLSPVNPLLAPLIRRRNGLTFRDRRKANFLYRCDAVCTSRPVCANEGFVDHTASVSARPNTEGERCERLRRSYYARPNCGGRVIREKTISSPGYPRSQRPQDGVCVWWIQAPPNNRVQLTFRAFDLYGRVRRFCIYDRFEIRLQSLYLGQTFCSDEIKPGNVVTSVGRDVVIEYRPYARFKRGFSAEIKFVPVQTTQQ